MQARGIMEEKRSVAGVERITYRFAKKQDAGLVLHFIRQLAIYEKMEDQVVATQALLEEWIFDKKHFFNTCVKLRISIRILIPSLIFIVQKVTVKLHFNHAILKHIFTT